MVSFSLSNNKSSYIIELTVGLEDTVLTMETEDTEEITMY